MVTVVEVLVVLLALAFIFSARTVVDRVKPFVANAVVGLVLLLIADALGYGVAVTPLVLLVVALAGGPGALLVLLLHAFGVAF